jgi:hypothetical protein
VDAFSLFLKRQQVLLDQREPEGVITQIQGLPGFEIFLKTPLFETLRVVASHGLVIIISHCKWRSDIFVVLYDSPPYLIPTAGDSHHRADILAGRLSYTRKMRCLESTQYRCALSSAS